MPEDSDEVALTDEALAEAMASSASTSEFANQPGRSEGMGLFPYFISPALLPTIGKLNLYIP